MRTRTRAPVLISALLALGILAFGTCVAAQSVPGAHLSGRAPASNTAPNPDHVASARQQCVCCDPKKSDAKADTPQPGKPWNFCKPESIDPWKTMALAIALAVLYWLGSVTVRWHRIATPTRELLRAQIESVAAQFDLLPASGDKGRLKDLLVNASNLVANRGVGGLADVLFWSRGKELTGWGYVHEVEVQMAALLPPETVEVRLTTVQAKLKAMTDPVSQVLAVAVANALSPGSTVTDPMKQALLAEALEQDYNSTDTSFAYLLSWQNKAAWLVAFGLLIALVVVGVDPNHSVFLLSGAVGGLLSRLSRSLERKEVWTDYGASWATLFLSPVAGALGGWAGCLISALAVYAQVLGNVFKDLWSCPPTALAVGAALAFGFSERLFDSVLDKLTDKTVGTPAKTTQPPAGNPPGAQGAQQGRG